MSQSLRSQSLPGGTPQPPRKTLPSAGDIADEINDHLECRQHDLEADGATRSEAKAGALHAFGNVRRVARKLFWMHHGERIMSQRLLWTAIVLIFAALMANLYFQMRSAAVMNEAIVRLTDRLARTQQPLGEALIKVVDENGQPRPGMKVTLTGENPSPYLSNAKYMREFESDDGGMIRTGPIPLGIYQTTGAYAKNKEFRARIYLTGPNCRLQDEGKTEELTITFPNLTVLPVTFGRPEVAGWTMQDYLTFQCEAHYGGTRVMVDWGVKFGELTQLPLLPSTEVRVYYTAESGNREKRPNESFRAEEKIARDDPRLVHGGTITLALPSNGTSDLTADGTVVPRKPAAGQKKVD